MRVIAWNVNSIRVRRERALALLDRHQPDVVCLQELKVTDKDYPFDDFREVGYHSETWGQKTYNGVAILSRKKPNRVSRGFEDGGDDEQARFISAEFDNTTVMSAYFPNGGEVGGPRYPYKLEWMKRLRDYLDRNHSAGDRIVLAGDFNVARDERDIAKPQSWQNTTLTSTDVRDAFRRIQDFGFADVLRQKNPDGGVFSWWDYRQLAFPKNDGLRIDYIFATHPLSDLCTEAFVDREERKGQSPSDHAPVIATFSD